MTNPAEKLPDPEPLPEIITTDRDNLPFLSRAIYDVSFALGGPELASSITSWDALDHESALRMLRTVQANAVEQVAARVEELKRLTEQQLDTTRKVGRGALQRIQDWLH